MHHFEAPKLRVGRKTPNKQKQNRDEIYVRSSFIMLDTTHYQNTYK